MMVEQNAPDRHELMRGLDEPGASDEQAMAAGEGSTSTGLDPSSKEYQQHMRWLTSVHRGSGHRSNASLLNTLRREEESPQVVRVAQEFHGQRPWLWAIAQCLCDTFCLCTGFHRVFFDYKNSIL